jgi:hypothetical protein
MAAALATLLHIFSLVKTARVADFVLQKSGRLFFRCNNFYFRVE